MSVNEINFNTYLDERNTTRLSLSLNFSFALIHDEFTSHILLSGGIENSSFWPVLEKIEDLVQSGSDVVINGYNLDLESFNQDAENFRAENFSIRELDYLGLNDVAFLHFARNVLLDYDNTYDDIIKNSWQYTKITDVKNAFHKNNDFFTGNENNVKWTSVDGHEEYIFRETTNGFELVTDSFNQGRGV